MPPPDDRARILHMIEAAETALEFVAGRSRAELDSDLMLAFALIHAVGIIGEAASRLSEEARAARPQIPWRQVISMRNRLVHAYFDVDCDVLWKTVTEELPVLLRQLRGL